MRKKAINHVYDVIKTVSDLENELRTTPVFAASARIDCSENLEVARQRLHNVLDQVRAADFRKSTTA